MRRTIRCCCRCARALLLAGRPDEARDVYSRLRPLLPIPTSNPPWPAVLLNLVDLIELTGDAEAARLVYDQLAPFRQYPGALGTSTAYFCGTVSRDLGRLARTAGRPARAAELLLKAPARDRALDRTCRTVGAPLSRAAAEGARPRRRG
ncbi:hypothetical protein [Streptomyces sp. NPDC088762]|uniref:hypothetical protein n=1 Tax=Streptomyces sp. NPDC088762 TaxID=3365891 RepID=UPI00382F9298